MKKWLTFLLAAALTLCALNALADESLVIDGGTADRVHLRAAPSTAAASLGLYFTGTEVVRTEILSGGWSRVKVGTELGYMRTEFLTEWASPAFPAYEVANGSSSWVNLRCGASLQMEAIGRLDNGAVVALMGETNSGWSYVRTAEGMVGYVSTALLKPSVGRDAVTRILGTTGSGDYIHALDAENGQTLYFVAAEAAPFILRQDVNFDGVPDWVVNTALGSTNAYYEFFVWTAEGYERALHPLVNYRLYPELGYVLTSGNNGFAGALFEDRLYEWNGTELRLIRRAATDVREEVRTEGDVFIITRYDRELVLTVTDYRDNPGGEAIHTEIICLDGATAETFDYMKEALWEGLD